MCKMKGVAFFLILLASLCYVAGQQIDLHAVIGNPDLKLKIGKCEMERVNNNGKIILKAKDNCKVDVLEVIENLKPVQDLSKETLTKIKDKIETLPFYKKLKAAAAQVKIEIDSKAKSVTIIFASEMGLTLIDDAKLGKLTVKDASMSISFNSDNFRVLGLDVKGTLSFGSTDVELESKVPLEEDKEEGKKKDISLKATLKKELSIKDLTQSLSTKIETSLQNVFQGNGGYKEKILGTVMKGIQLEVTIDPDTLGLSLLVFSGSMELKETGNWKFYFIIAKEKDGPFGFAIAGSLQSVKLSKIISWVTGSKKEIKLLSDVSFDATIMASTRNILLMENSDLANLIMKTQIKEEGLKEKNEEISEGFFIDLSKTNPNSENANDKQKQGILMEYRDGNFDFSMNYDFSLQPSKLFDLWEMQTPSWLKQVNLGFKIGKFSFDKDGLSVLDIYTNGDVEFGPLIINNVELNAKREENKWKFYLKANWKIVIEEEQLEFAVELFGQDKLLIRIPSIKITSLLAVLKQMDINKIPNGDFLQTLELTDINIEWAFADKLLRISAQASSSELLRVNFELLLKNVNGKFVSKLGLFIAKNDICSIFKELFKTEIKHGCWLKDTTLELISTEESLKAESFTTTSLQTMKTADKGISIRLIANPPRECRGARLCELWQDATKNKEEKQTELTGKFESLTKFKIMAKIAFERKEESGIMLRDMFIAIEVDGAKANLYFGITVVCENNQIQARIGIGTTGDLRLEGEFNGKWENPFDIPNVAIYYLKVGVSLNLITTIPGISFGAKFKIDTVDVEVHMYAAIGNANDIYFYGHVEQLTFGNICKLFGIEKTPRLLQESGIKSLTISYASAEQKVSEDLVIKPGFVIDGAIKLFNMDLKCHVELSKEKFKVHVQMNAFGLGGFVVLKKLASDKKSKDSEEGPEFLAMVSKNGFKIYINAEISVLGVTAGSELLITDETFSLTVKGNLFNVFEATLKLQADYPGMIKYPSFKVQGTLTIGKMVEDRTKAEINALGNEAKREEKRIEGQLEELNDIRQTVSGTEKDYQKRVDNLNEEVNDNVDKIEALKNLNECLDKCKKEPMGGVVWNDKCIEIKEKVFLGCPEWKKDAFQYPELACIAKCKGETLIKRLTQAVKQLFTRLLENIKSRIESIKEVLRKAKKILEPYMEKVKNVYTEVKAKFKEAGDLLKTVMISKVEVSFNVDIIAAATSSIGLDLSYTLNDKVTKHHVEAELGRNLVKNVVKKILKESIKAYESLKEKLSDLKKGISKLFNSHESVKTVVEEATSQNFELTKEEKQLQLNPKKRGNIPTRSVQEIKQIIYSPLPEFTLHDHETVKAFNDFIPGQIYSNLNTLPRMREEKIMNMNPIRRQTVTDVNRLSSCAQLKHTVSEFGEITNSLQKLMRAFLIRERKFRNSSREKREKLKNIGKLLRRQCSTTEGCNDNNLQDILHYVKKARDATTVWVKTVRSVIKRQNGKTFDIWRRNMNKIYKQLKGMAVDDYAKALYLAVMNRGERRSKISGQVYGYMASMTKDLGDLFDESKTLNIMQAYPTIKNLEASQTSLVQSSLLLKRSCINAPS